MLNNVSTCLRRFVFALFAFPRRPARRRRRQEELRQAVRVRTRKLEIFCEAGLDARECSEKVLDALRTIEHVDRVRFNRLLREVPRYFVRGGGGAAYWDDVGVCILEATHVREKPPHDIALRIVHEGAHARLHRRGIPWWPDLFERIERQCIKQEIAFCRRLGRHGYGVSGRLRWYVDRLTRPVHTTSLVRAYRRREKEARSSRY